MTFKTKITHSIIIILILSGILIISINSLFQIKNEQNMLNHMKDSVYLIKNISSVVFYLQKERGMVNMYLNGEKNIYSDIEKERNLVDTHFQIIKDLNNKNHYFDNLGEIESKLKSLRKVSEEKKVEYIYIFDEYTKLINELIDYYDYPIKQKTTAETGKLLTSIYYLEKIKEYAGEFRGIYSSIIKKQNISEKEYFFLDKSFYNIIEFSKFKGFSYTEYTYKKVSTFPESEYYKKLLYYYELFENKSPKLYQLNPKETFENLTSIVDFFQNIINHELSKLEVKINMELKDKKNVLFIDIFSLIFSGILFIYITINYYSLIKLKNELNKSLGMFQTIFENSPIGIIIFDTNLNVSIANNAALKILDVSKEQLIGLDLNTLPHNIIKNMIKDTLKNKLSYYEGEYNSSISGKNIILRATFAPLKKDHFIIGGIAIIEDYTQKKIMEDKLKHLATHDLLTGLPNRTLFFENSKNLLSLGKRNNLKYAIMFIDIDNFKKVNDTFGHEKGDELLKHMAKILKETLRSSDIISRFGGDEFVILTQYKNIKDIYTITQKLNHKMSKKFEKNGGFFSISLSIGVSLFPEHSEDIDDLIRYADIAMYEAKKVKNTTIIYKTTSS
ncbi:diguanylate cyclase [Marinitoga lauensis]|uniref:diguanylate cyclase n=1 Tax=Marinitoga lauensis TaxID=2201189 RepID=UPI00101313EB|nr:diguanylate cyclase [Marinitoga lauensis]